jgi:hypothetical protein
MPSPHVPSVAPLAAFVGAALVLAACTTDAPTSAVDGPLDLTSPSGASVETVALCHHSEAKASILEIGPPALRAHLAHGDYVTTLRVTGDSDAPPDNVHFATIGGALSAARSGRLAREELVSAACRISIIVPSGVYIGTALVPASGLMEHFPLIVDVPDITLRGALVMGLDGSGRATGEAVGGEETTLRPAEPLPILSGVTTPMIVANAHPTGSAGNGLTVEGFVFESGHDPAVDAGGQGVLSMRATGVTIRGNRFGGGFTESLDARGGGVDVLQNHLGGGAGTCDVCLAGPGTFRAVGNHLDAGGIPGIDVSAFVNLPVPVDVEPSSLPATAETWAEIRNNEVRNHRRIPVGTGIRVDAVGVGAPNVHNTLHVEIRDNLVVNNRFGLIVHAAFPVANTNRRGDVDVTLGGNQILESCQASLLVSLSRHTTALGLTSNPYLLNSSFQLALGGDLSWDEAWFGHPAGFGNTLVVDGQAIANGSRHFYSAAGCPGA